MSRPVSWTYSAKLRCLPLDLRRGRGEARRGEGDGGPGPLLEDVEDPELRTASTRQGDVHHDGLLLQRLAVVPSNTLGRHLSDLGEVDPRDPPEERAVANCSYLGAFSANERCTRLAYGAIDDAHARRPAGRRTPARSRPRRSGGCPRTRSRSGSLSTKMRRRSTMPPSSLMKYGMVPAIHLPLGSRLQRALVPGEQQRLAATDERRDFVQLEEMPSHPSRSIYAVRHRCSASPAERWYGAPGMDTLKRRIVEAQQRT